MWRFYLCFFAGADPERTYNGFDSHSDGLLIGCLLALGNPHRFVQTAARYAVIPAIAMLCIFLLLPHRTIFTQTFGLTLSAAISAWLILGAMGEGWLKHWLTRPWMVFTGRISYAWYLWHYPVILWSREIFPQTGAAKYLAMFVAAAAGYLAAAASYRWVTLERAMRLGRPLPLNPIGFVLAIGVTLAAIALAVSIVLAPS